VGASQENLNNPLRNPQDKRLPRIAGPGGLVIFGVTGDLARKKLLPAKTRVFVDFLLEQFRQRDFAAQMRPD